MFEVALRESAVRGWKRVFWQGGDECWKKNSLSTFTPHDQHATTFSLV